MKFVILTEEEVNVLADELYAASETCAALVLDTDADTVDEYLEKIAQVLARQKVLAGLQQRLAA